MRMVVVGDPERFDAWMQSLPQHQRDPIRPIIRWSDMLGFHRASVEFMPDWRESPDRSMDEDDRILEEAQEMERRRKQMSDPFLPPGADKPHHRAPSVSTQPTSQEAPL